MYVQGNIHILRVVQCISVLAGDSSIEWCSFKDQSIIAVLPHSLAHIKAN